MYSYSSTYSRFKAFHFLWIVFVLWHMLIASPGWTNVGNEFLNPSNYFFLAVNVLVILFGTASLFWCKKLSYFLLTIICLTIVKLDALPSVPNHIILTILINLTILSGLLLYRDTSLNYEERIVNWFQKTAPYIRIELLLLYFFVVLHKLNYDYFNPAVSCSVELYADITSILTFLPQGAWIYELMIVMILLLELAILLLLIFPTTRVIGVFTGLIFHFLLSLHPNLYILSFTAELYALYILFLPDELIQQITNKVKVTTEKIDFIRMMKGSTGIVVLVGLFYLTTRYLQTGTLSISWLKKDVLGLFDLIPFFWSIWCLLIIAGAFSLFRGNFIQKQQTSSFLFSVSWSPLVIFPMLTFFNGISPYIGLKTATNFSMFSNLKVDAADNNHFFMTSRYRISNLQDDTITLLSTNNSYLQDFIDRNERMTYFELSRFLYQNQDQDIRAEFIRNGSKQSIHLPEQKSENYLKSTWISRKLLLFRGVKENGPTPCQW